MSKRTAQILAEMMVGAVQQGTAKRVRVPGLVIGAKTGTAQKGGQLHARFVALTPERKPGLAVVVLVERGGTGGQIGAAIARKVIRAFRDLGPGEEKKEEDR